MRIVGITARIPNAIERVSPGPIKFWVVVPAAVLFFLLTWSVILCRYAIFGLLLCRIGLCVADSASGKLRRCATTSS
jgi:hypothetical protein